MDGSGDNVLDFDAGYVIANAQQKKNLCFPIDQDLFFFHAVSVI